MATEYIAKHHPLVRRVTQLEKRVKTFEAGKTLYRHEFKISFTDYTHISMAANFKVNFYCVAIIYSMEDNIKDNRDLVNDALRYGRFVLTREDTFEVYHVLEVTLNPRNDVTGVTSLTVVSINGTSGNSYSWDFDLDAATTYEYSATEV